MDQACTGENVGLNIKDLDKNNMSRSEDVMVDKKDRTLGRTKEFNAPIQVLDIPNQIKEGFSIIGFVRSGCTACRNSALKWTMRKETGGSDSSCTTVKSREWMRPGAKNALVEGGVNRTLVSTLFPSLMYMFT